MDVHAIYNLDDRKFEESALALDTPFIRQLSHLSQTLANDLKAVTFILKDRSQNRGEIQQRGIPADAKSVLDICKLTPLARYKGASNLLEEVAMYRADLYGFSQRVPDFAKKNAEMLMVDYLLATSLCYVETFVQGQVKDKFLATRNPRIAVGLTGKEEELEDYKQYLQTFQSHFETRQLNLLKINMKKKGFTVTRPRSAINFGISVKVTPLFMITSLVEGLSKALETKMVKFTYVKDNMHERELVTTLSPSILTTYYSTDMVKTMFSNIETTIARGHTKLPELGISKYDKTGVRSLNLARITKIEEVQMFDTETINVDLNMTLPSFISGIERCQNTAYLKQIYTDLTRQQRIPYTDVFQLKNGICDVASSNVAIQTTTALRQLHRYMIANPKVFSTYNMGVPVDISYTGLQNDSFDLGGKGGF